MLPLSLTLATIFIATLGFLYWYRKTRDKGYKPIPGPIGLPMLGNVLQVGSKMHLQFSRWANKYGEIFQIHLGNRRSVVISDPQMVKEIFSNDPAFTGRAIFEGYEAYTNEPLGIASIEGEMWEVHRRFLLRQLRDFGFGKSSMEELVQEEVKMLIAHLKTFEGQPIKNLKQMLQISVLNSLWMIISNKRFSQDDPAVKEMMSDLQRVLEEMMKNIIVLFVPWTKYILPSIKVFDEVKAKGLQFYIDAVDAHKSTYQEDNLRDFIDAYLKEMKSQSSNPSSMFYGDKAERQLHVLLGDIMFAGNDTTATTISWAILYLTKFRDIQERIQKEIHDVTGDARPVALSDRPKMPYTMAVIEETFRISPVIPTGLQHRAIKGREFRDYFIPEDTWIFANIYHIHHDEKLWTDPKKFKPERFLSEDGTVFKKNSNLLTFSIGRRQCVGETLARDSFFLFLTNIFQRYSITFDPEFPEPSLEPVVGFLLSPQPFTIQIQDRIVD
ncbi:Farnesoate epoxidase [Orchesella cincta]|uniref:Farnesoate epoxidase n=1 Tax=Orchesella cincta TaxID=48709 RepID=A0A1D2N6M7_ORCCI|nr:Farnesoate epoxidase [Orchesella cincta]